MSVNLAILVGHVGRDPEIRSMNNGDKVASFSIATSEVWTDKASGEKREATEWHNIVCFNQQMIDKVIEPYVKKGGRLSVQGAIKTRKYTDKDGAERRATEIVIGRFDGKIGLEGQPQGGTRSEDSYGERRTRGSATDNIKNQYEQQKSGGAPRNADLDDDIPF